MTLIELQNGEKGRKDRTPHAFSMVTAVSIFTSRICRIDIYNSRDSRTGGGEKEIEFWNLDQPYSGTKSALPRYSWIGTNEWSFQSFGTASAPVIRILELAASASF